MIRLYTTSDTDSLLELFRLNTPNSFAQSEEVDFKNYLEHELEDYFVYEEHASTPSNEIFINGCPIFDLL